MAIKQMDKSGFCQWPATPEVRPHPWCRREGCTCDCHLTEPEKKDKVIA